MKKILVFIMALVLMSSLCMTAFAAGGTITVNNALVGEDYNLYRILDLSTDFTGTKFTYTVPANGEWDAFYAQNDVKEILKIDAESKVVTWKEDVEGSNGAAALAKLALAYVKQNSSVNATATKTADSTTVKFEGLDYGYYLLNTSIGSVCSLDSNNTAVVINDKQPTPILDKKIWYDYIEDWSDMNTAGIGDTVHYKITLSNVNNINNLEFIDTLSNGLTFKPETLKVNCHGVDVSAGENTYKLVTAPEAPQTFSVKFTNGHHDLTSADTIVIKYDAIVNDDAVIRGEGNPNTAKITYGNSQESAYVSTVTYVYDFIIKKVDTTAAPLADAKFVVSRGDTTKEYAVVENGKLTGWTTVKTDAVLTSPADGLIYIKGLDAGNYAIEETEAPAGYNKILGNILVKIAENGVVSSSDNTPYTDNTVEIVNASGTQLPSTGGIGTTIFVTVGMIGIIVLGVFLVTNKRIKKEGF